MNAVIAVVFGLMVSAPVVAEPLIEGWVRQSSGEPVEAAQVLVFDWTDLRRGAVAQATTDAAGYFELPLAALTGSVLPTSFTLGQNYPNPFNPSTIIPYQVPTAAHVRLEVFNVLGQRVATLVDEDQSAGVHTAVWDATDASGRAVGAGVYFYRLSSAGQPALTRRMVLLDGQAGQAAGSVPLPPGPSSASAAEGVYGLAVTGAGLVTYVDASFGVRSGMAAVEVVVDAVAGLPRGKVLTGGVLGDVNGDGQVTLDDALLVTTYVVNGSVELPASGDISLGDVNGDGQVTLEDAQLLTAYVANPADPSLPAGIGQAVSGSGEAWVAGAIRRLTNHPEIDRHSSWSPDGRHIAFESYRDDNYEIYVMGSDGSNLRNLTNHWEWDRHPSWSPDGRHIAFESYRDGNWEIYVMGSDGSNPRRLTNDSDRDRSPSWSPDGRHIAFESYRDGNGEIYVMASDGSNPRRLTKYPADDFSPSWSPDGRHIAFESYRDGNGEIYVMASDGSNPRRLTNHSADDFFPSWSPDGRHIAFHSDRDGNGEIYVMASDGSNPRRLTTISGTSPSWSPDGRHIAFVSWHHGNGEIYVMALREAGSGGTPFDDGDSPATATPLAVGESIEGDLSVGDIDYFRVTVTNAGRLFASAFGNKATYGYIEDSSGNVLYEDGSRSPPGLEETFNVLVLEAVVEPGTYYIRVVGVNASSTGDYQLELHLDEDGSPSTAIPLTVGESIEGEIWTGTSKGWVYDIDYFRVTVTNAGRLVASMISSYSKDGYIEDSSGNVLDDLDYNVFSNDPMSMSAIVEPGTYYIRVSGRAPGFIDDTGYTLTLAFQRIHRLTNHPAADFSPVWSPDGHHIAFESDRDDNREIYVMGSDGSNPRNLTNHSAGDFFPSWSPDGRHIAFHSDRDGNSEIYVMDSDGSNPRRLTNDPAKDRVPSWSPDGRHIAFRSERDGNSEIYVMDSDGSNPRNLTNHSAGDFFPSWSPDGRHIAFESYRDGNGEIYVMGSDGSNPRNLTNHSAWDFFPSWSPDGRHIAFRSERDGNFEMIYVMGSDGSNPRNLTNGWYARWSPDGRHIAFSSYHVGDGNWEIYVIEFGEAGSGGTPLDQGDSGIAIKKDRIVEVLFGLNPDEADAKTNHDYNDYMARPNDTGECDGYRGGHSGWDVQTQSVAGDDKTADEEFYSLTSGQVIAIGGEFGKIAVYNATDDKTTLYLHAREIYVSQGQTVNIGTALGIQGNVGLGFSDPSKNEHVHIEVRDGRSEYPSCGAGATTDPINIDPIDCLYEAIQAQ